MRGVRIHDTLSGEVRALKPREPGKLGIYACGPTVYARVHVGNARPFVVFALLKRFLQHEGYEVTLVENVTDVNDKIYDAARRVGVGSEQLATEMAEHYVADTSRLELGRPDHEPRAAGSVEAIVALIADLIEGGHAYAADGDVYFRVESFGDYGKLSNRPPLEMRQGEGDDAAQRKESPRDFALWKAHKDDEDTSWPAPWGEGRPGWHIECSAMAEELLGTDFEIHGGGSDLVFPHHENEIAQTEAARGRPLARIWMHNGMVQMGTEKMAKSVGNIHLLNEALDRYGRDTLVAYFSSGHYRQPIGYSAETLEESSRAVQRLRDLIDRLDPDTPAFTDVDPYAERFLDHLADDFNTPAARSVLFEWVGEANRRLAAGQSLGVGRLAEMLFLLGLEGLLTRPVNGPDAAAAALLEARDRARAERDFERADALRDELSALGWTVRDTAEGARLVRGT
ncbi:MAG: cysteine--tRNA ligase [Thermoleophilaceae bacterium]